MAVIVSISSISPEKKENTKIFHVRLADPKLYVDGIFSDGVFFETHSVSTKTSGLE